MAEAENVQNVQKFRLVTRDMPTACEEFTVNSAKQCLKGYYKGEIEFFKDIARSSALLLALLNGICRLSSHILRICAFSFSASWPRWNQVCFIGKVWGQLARYSGEIIWILCDSRKENDILLFGRGGLPRFFARVIAIHDKNIAKKHMYVNLYIHVLYVYNIIHTCMYMYIYIYMYA